MDLLKDFKNEAKLAHIALILLIVALAIHIAGFFWDFLSIFSDVFIVIASAWILSFILEPMIDLITNHTPIPKSMATLITYLLLFLIITGGVFFFIPIVVEQIKTLVTIIPKYFASAPPIINKWGNSITDSMTNSISFLPSVAQFFFLIFITILLAFYFNMDRDPIKKELLDLVPASWHAKLQSFYKVTDVILASFLRVQLIFGILAGISTWIVLVLFGIDFAIAISFLSGLFAIIPMVGPLLAIIPPILIAAFIDPVKAVIIAGVLLAIQQVIFNIIGPKLLGNALKLHPAVILISFIIGAKVGGGVGAIFAIPVIGILAVYIKELGKHVIRLESKK